MADSAALAASVTEASCAPATLGLETTYYWKVVEVNQAETPSAWDSDIWSFSTLTYLPVDNFESYTNESPNRVFQTWIDGTGFSPDEFFPAGNDGNGSGAMVGCDPTLGNIMEPGIVRPGSTQSMPLAYDNSQPPRYSEAVRTYTDPQDWSGHGIKTLVVYFRGDVNNAPAPVYVKINNGTASGDPVYGQGLTGLGKALGFDGTNDYVDLPIGSLVSALSSSSFAVWVYFNNVGNAWQQIFDFGNPGVGTASPNVYMFLSSNNGSRIVRFAIRTATVNEQIVNGLAAPTTGWHHAAVVIDSASMTLRLYQDGLLVRSGATTVLPKALGVTTQNWLGRSQYTTDPYFGGAVDDLRIYNRALSESEVRYLAGDR